MNKYIITYNTHTTIISGTEIVSSAKTGNYPFLIYSDHKLVAIIPENSLITVQYGSENNIP